tara:strand:- start:1334 stop:1624 length:291 start_codon:yes stop_codon:yes gene_type:complete
MALRPFHIAFPVDDLAAAREFYCGLLGCREGRSSERWIDFDLYSHQIVAAGVEFLVAPHVRFRGEPGEQATMFFRDPAGNALEFKAFANDEMIFSR